MAEAMALTGEAVERERARAVSPGGDGLELTSAIDAIRGQLTEAMARSEGQRLQFELGNIELEFEVALTRETSVDGGVRVWVINMGASGARTTSAVTRVKVTLKPTDAGSGQAPVVSDHLESIPPR
jgi:hypothetical protein